MDCVGLVDDWRGMEGKAVGWSVGVTVYVSSTCRGAGSWPMTWEPSKGRSSRAASTAPTEAEVS